MMGLENWLAEINIKTGIVFLAIFLLAVYTFFYRNQEKRKRLPPTPFSLPIVGTLPFLGRDIREGVRKLSEKFGDVVTVRLGSDEIVFLNSHAAIKEAFVQHGHAFAGRPQDDLVVNFFTEGIGIIGTQGDQWKQQRKLAHGILREFGVGKSILEDKIREEIGFFLDEIERSCGKPVDIHYTLMLAAANIMGSIIFGSRYDYDDPDFIRYNKSLNAVMVRIGQGSLVSMLPWLRHLPGDMFHFKEMTSNLLHLRSYYSSQVKEHKAKFNPNHVTDFIDAYLKVISERTQDESEVFTERQLSGIIADFFVAGSETTATTLRWGIVFLVNHPEVQVKVQSEIDDVIGKGRLPKMQDKGQMPYTEACLLEIQRLGDIVPFGGQHAILEDVQFRDFYLPQGLKVFANIYSAHRDPKAWKKPFDFDPTHFLDADGKVFKKEQFIPFSMGKRVCLGESLARMELFLLFTSMLQRFSFSVAPGDPMPSMKEGILGITYMPKPFKVTINRL